MDVHCLPVMLSVVGFLGCCAQIYPMGWLVGQRDQVVERVATHREKKGQIAKKKKNNYCPNEKSNWGLQQ